MPIIAAAAWYTCDTTLLDLPLVTEQQHASAKRRELESHRMLPSATSTAHWD